MKKDRDIDDPCILKEYRWSDQCICTEYRWSMHIFQDRNKDMIKDLEKWQTS